MSEERFDGYIRKSQVTTVEGESLARQIEARLLQRGFGHIEVLLYEGNRYGVWAPYPERRQAALYVEGYLAGREDALGGDR